jgi:hypothetical protein
MATKIYAFAAPSERDKFFSPRSCRALPKVLKSRWKQSNSVGKVRCHIQPRELELAIKYLVENNFDLVSAESEFKEHYIMDTKQALFTEFGEWPKLIEAVDEKQTIWKFSRKTVRSSGKKFLSYEEEVYKNAEEPFKGCLQALSAVKDVYRKLGFPDLDIGILVTMDVKRLSLASDDGTKIIVDHATSSDGFAYCVLSIEFPLDEDMLATLERGASVEEEAASGFKDRGGLDQTVSAMLLISDSDLCHSKLLAWIEQFDKQLFFELKNGGHTPLEARRSTLQYDVLSPMCRWAAFQSFSATLGGIPVMSTMQVEGDDHAIFAEDISEEDHDGFCEY